eukprot:TRINITY_DN57602_c0_g1_i1.p2 TRINITY_DN57602_c0_g1~~TRINITY_DN57602_c0_g1_i1.p2  ORF type:complete len:132 (+),score=30.33 TRINITY_DN57602_c0_g1_i1:44-397(+)
MRSLVAPALCLVGAFFSETSATVQATLRGSDSRDESCAAQDLKRRSQLQASLAGACEDLCKDVGAYPKCTQCADFEPPDATPGVMTWEELLTHQGNLLSWSREQIKSWTAQASKSSR